MIGIGPFIPHSATPLKDAAGGTVEDTLVMIAMARLMVPEALMPATTAMGTLDPSGREKAIQAGANVVMPILSPLQIRSKYALYEQKSARAMSRSIAAAALKCGSPSPATGWSLAGEITAAIRHNYKTVSE